MLLAIIVFLVLVPALVLPDDFRFRLPMKADFTLKPLQASAPNSYGSPLSSLLIDEFNLSVLISNVMGFGLKVGIVYMEIPFFYAVLIRSLIGMKLL